MILNAFDLKRDKVHRNLSDDLVTDSSPSKGMISEEKGAYVVEVSPFEIGIALKY